MCPSDKRQIRENRRNSELMEPMSYEINQLIPYTAYNVWLNAINDAGNGNRSESLVTTDSEGIYFGRKLLNLIRTHNMLFPLIHVIW